MEQVLCTKRRGDITERRGRNDDTDIRPREQCKQRKESNSHQGDSNPHPAHAKCAHQYPADGSRPQRVDFANLFHGMTDRDITGGATQNHNRDEHDHSHGSSLRVVLGSVPPTIATPPQMNRTPIHRAGETDSPSSKYPSNATIA